MAVYLHCGKYVKLVFLEKNDDKWLIEWACGPDVACWRVFETTVVNNFITKRFQILCYLKNRIHLICILLFYYYNINNNLFIILYFIIRLGHCRQKKLTWL